MSWIDFEGLKEQHEEFVVVDRFNDIVLSRVFFARNFCQELSPRLQGELADFFLIETGYQCERFSSLVKYRN